MDIKTVYAVYFSATGNTRRVTERLAATLAAALGKAAPTVIDFTSPRSREGSYAFGADDLVVFGCPTYAGKLPNKLLPFVQSGFAGNGALCVPIVTFGNRAYDNSLAELCASMESARFHTVAAAAFVCRHPFSETLAAERPDADDLRALERFAVQTAEAVRAMHELPAPIRVPGDAAAPYYVPKGLDGQPTVFMKAKPVTDAARCSKCGKCVELCPMGSISAADPAEVAGVCIKCHACVRLCPEHAKYFDDPAFLSHRAYLEQTYARRAKNEVYLPIRDDE